MSPMMRVSFLGLIVSACALGSAALPANYVIDRDVSIRTSDRATLCALIVRPASATPLPAALEFTIYVDPKKDLNRLAADRGFAAVMAYTRGKACSPQKVVPYEYDGQDANSVIDWISRQPWSDGQVGMIGGSYDGFTQWAAASWRTST